MSTPTYEDLLRVAENCDRLVKHGDPEHGETVYWVGLSISRQSYSAPTLRELLAEIWRAEWVPENEVVRVVNWNDVCMAMAARGIE